MAWLEPVTLKGAHATLEPLAAALNLKVATIFGGVPQNRQVAALRSALRVADLRYKGGVTSYVDVLLAKRTLFDAEFALAGTRRLHLVSVVQLYRALGGGWSPT